MLSAVCTRVHIQVFQLFDCYLKFCFQSGVFFTWSRGFPWRAVEDVCYKKFNQKLNWRVNHVLMGGWSSTERHLLRSDEILGLARKPMMSHPAALYYFLTFSRRGFVSRSGPAPIHTAPHWEPPIITTAPYWEPPIITTACSWSAPDRSTEAAVSVYWPLMWKLCSVIDPS